MAQESLVKQIQDTFFAAPNQIIRIGNEHGAARSEIHITRVQKRLVSRSKPIEHGKSAATDTKSEEAIGKFSGTVPISVSGQVVDISGRIDDGSARRLPYATLASIRSCAEDAHSL